MKNFTLVRKIQQLEVLITCPSKTIPDPYVIDTIKEDIAYKVTTGHDESGTEFFNGFPFKWEIQYRL